jgi:hypothetical protein
MVVIMTSDMELSSRILNTSGLQYGLFDDILRSVTFKLRKSNFVYVTKILLIEQLTNQETSLGFSVQGFGEKQGLSHLSLLTSHHSLLPTHRSLLFLTPLYRYTIIPSYLCTFVPSYLRSYLTITFSTYLITPILISTI